MIEYTNVSLTAVAASPTNDFTVAYLGTSNGQLRRLVRHSNTPKDKKVSLIKVHECNQYKTCTDCLGARDPHCGIDVPNRTEEIELDSISLHQNEDFLGLRPAEAELNFQEKASLLDTHVVDPYPVKEGGSHEHFLIRVNHRGIVTFRDSKMTNLFSWEEIERTTVDNKLVVIYCCRLQRKNDKNVKMLPDVHLKTMFLRVGAEMLTE